MAPTPKEVADERGPDSPTDLTKQSAMFVLRKTAREFSKDQCTDLAAALTYYAVLALFPAMIALLSLVGLFNQGPSTVKTLLGILNQMGAGSMVSSVQKPLTDLAAAPQAAGVAFVVGLLGALWSASGYVGSFGRAMNRMYEIREGRPIWKLRPLMLLVTLVALLLAAAVALALVLTGPAAQAVGDAIGLGSTAVLVWNIAKWPVMLFAVVLIVALLYYATPNVKQPKFRWLSIGAVLAIVVWIVASALFGSTWRPSPPTTRRTARSPASWSSCSGCGSPTWRCCSAPSWTPSWSVAASCRPDCPPRTPSSWTPGTPAGSRRPEQKEAEDVARGREIREASGAGSEAPRG